MRVVVLLGSNNNDGEVVNCVMTIIIILIIKMTKIRFFHFGDFFQKIQKPDFSPNFLMSHFSYFYEFFGANGINF